MLETQGFVLLPGLLTPDDCATLAAEVDKYLPLQDGNTARPPNSGGQRNLLKYPWCKALAERLQGMPAIAPLLPTSSVAVQCTYFEKTRARNWLVPLHQDLSIPVAERVEYPALRGWSEKDCALFVQPPARLLQELLAVRLHLDPCQGEDGPLRVVPATHQLGVLTPRNAQALRDASGEVLCVADLGTALAMRPLLLHASSKSTSNRPRRVLHFVFGPATLPWGLAWSKAVFS